MRLQTRLLAAGALLLPATALAGATVEHYNDYVESFCFEDGDYDHCVDVSGYVHAVTTPSGNYKLILDLVTVETFYLEGDLVYTYSFAEQGNGLDKGDGWVQIHVEQCIQDSEGYEVSVQVQVANGELVYERTEDSCD